MFVDMFLGVLVVRCSWIFMMPRKIEASRRWLSLAMNEAQIDAVATGINLVKAYI